ncbi:MAG: polyribonucleotide nucleotidyltransferase [Oscillospiraceae bacterium]|nr:polyribonucleotide nucleotidyltransferase [Oscillospiraceae bacterium]
MAKSTYSIEFAGRELTAEVGQLALLSGGSVLIRYGDTVILSVATMAESQRDGIDYFPLSVDYEEKLYSVGKIPGGFIKREGRPTEKAILTARNIDRPMRPLFPSDLRKDVAVINTVLSVEQDNSPEIAAMIGSSIAVSISSIPFNGPIGGVVLGLVDGEVILNPNQEQRDASAMSVTLAGTADKIMMIEAGADEVPDEVMLDAIIKGHAEIQKMVGFINRIVADVGKPKQQYVPVEVPAELFVEVKAAAYDQMRLAVLATEKQDRDEAIAKLTEDVAVRIVEKYGEGEIAPSVIKDAIYQLEKKVVREYLIKERRRVDGRGLDDIRELHAEVGLLPRVHGSALFSRGQTQVLTTLTIAPMSEVQRLDGVDLEESKRYMHHYNFPSYSVGEARPPRGPGRREIGHGALAERALEPVIPDDEAFPYAIRLVSEVLMSNGSTSQGSVCASTLALMDGGVPIKSPVAGISAGLIVGGGEGEGSIGGAGGGTGGSGSGGGAAEDYMVFMDIQGIEDFFGDMDFKVAGTKEGITAIQMDIKVPGLSFDIIRDAFEMTRKGRIKIIDEVILATLPAPREELSVYAPKILTTTIDPEKIRDVIGSGGKVINRIIAETGTKIDVEDDGRVYVATTDLEAGQRAIRIIEGIVKNPNPGDVFDGTVTRLMTFGAFVEFLPGKEGLVHISKLAKKRINKVEDVCAVGDAMQVKVLEIDKQGRINLAKVLD